MEQRTAELARGWFEAWRTYDMEWLRRWLAPDFAHVSPLGRFDGRDTYLEAVEPMARKSVVDISVKEILTDGNHAVVRYENRTPSGAVEACDWIRIEGDLIKEITAFYDAAGIREILDGA